MYVRFLNLFRTVMDKEIQTCHNHKKFLGFDIFSYHLVKVLCTRSFLYNTPNTNNWNLVDFNKHLSHFKWWKTSFHIWVFIKM